jgi:hypothetical protein
MDTFGLFPVSYPAMPELNPQPLPPGRSIRITIPAAVAFNLGEFQKSIATLVERTGCRTCFSGADCHFQQERDFLINEKMEFTAFPASVQGPPDPVPWRTATATLPAKVANNIEQVKSVVARIAGRLGCGACCSGFDILFQQELEFVVNEAGEVRG